MSYIIELNRVQSSPTQRIERLPTEFATMRRLTTELVDELDNVRDAKKNFKTENVKKSLGMFIELVIRAAQRIAQHFSRSKTGTIVFYFVDGRTLT